MDILKEQTVWYLIRHTHPAVEVKPPLGALQEMPAGRREYWGPAVQLTASTALGAGVDTMAAAELPLPVEAVGQASRVELTYLLVQD